MSTMMQNPAIEALREQLALYQKLQRLCAIQREYVQQNQIEEFVSILEVRGGLLGDIGRLEEIIAPLKRNWPTESATMNEAIRAEVQSMLAEAKSLLAEITQSDQDDVLLLQQRKLNVGKQIAATSTAKKVNTRYAANAYGAAQGSRLNISK